MSGKICPIISTENTAKECLGEGCMMFVQKTSTGSCGLTDHSAQLLSRMDTLSAQVQEIQIALIGLTNA